MLYEYSWWTKYFLASNLLIQTSGHKMAALIAYFAWTLLSASFEQTEQALVDEVLFFFASNLLVQTSGHKMAALRACSAWPLSSDSFEQTEQAIVDEVLFFFFFFFFCFKFTGTECWAQNGSSQSLFWTLSSASFEQTGQETVLKTGVYISFISFIPMESVMCLWFGSA